MKHTKGFTIVEVVVTVVVIGILVSIGIFSYSKVQSESRDSKRSSQIGVLVEALEKYFAKNGEYPSCAAMTQSASTVASTLGIDPQALIAPRATSGVTNSITCTSLPGSGPDAYAYVGDGSATCNTGNSCLQYTLQYREEGTGAIKSIASRHQTQIVTSGTTTITATPVGNTQINLSWTDVSGATSYQLQRATDSNFTANLTTSTPSGTAASASGLTAGTTYYFRIAAVSGSGQGDWSAAANASTSIDAPTSTPTTSANLVSNNAVGTSNTVTCASGTAQYQLRSRSTATAATGSWSSWSAWAAAPGGQTLSVAASEGFQYGFQAQARCMGPSVGSNTTAVSNIPTVVRPINTPAAPTYLSPSFFDSPNHAIVNFAGSCPAGTNIINASFRSRAWTGSNWGPNPWAFDDWWTNNTGSNKNVEYWGKYQCQTTYSTSPMSPESYNAIVVTP